MPESHSSCSANIKQFAHFLALGSVKAWFAISIVAFWFQPIFSQSILLLIQFGIPSQHNILSTPEMIPFAYLTLFTDYHAMQRLKSLSNFSFETHFSRELPYTYNRSFSPYFWYFFRVFFFFYICRFYCLEDTIFSVFLFMKKRFSAGDACHLN